VTTSAFNPIRTRAREGCPDAILGLGPDKAGALFKGMSPQAQRHLLWWQRKEGGRRPTGVPVLFQDKQTLEGKIGWMQLHSVFAGMGSPRNAAGDSCQAALKSISRLLGSDSFRLFPVISLAENHGDTIRGSSASLAVLVDWMHDLLDIHPNSTLRCSMGSWVATGGWSKATNQFQSVDPGSLKAKSEVAAKWGYTTLIVVEDQEIPVGALASGMQVIKVPREPIGALLELLRQDCAKDQISSGQEHLQLRLLRTIKHGWTNSRTHRIDPAPDLIEQLHRQSVESDQPTLRVITSDVLGRHAFRRGDKEATEYLGEVEKYLPRARFMDPMTALYYRTEWHTNPAEGRIDQGDWQTDSRWEKLAQIAQSDIDTYSWDIPTLFGKFTVANQISFRHLFQARLEDESEKAVEHLEAAQDLRLAYQDYWDDFWEYSKYRTDTYPGRQRNLLLEVAWTEHLLEQRGVLPAEKKYLSQLSEPIQRLASSLTNPDNTGHPHFDRLSNWTLHFLLNEQSTVDEITDSFLKTLINRTDGDLSKTLDPSSPNRWLLERIILSGQFSNQETVISILESVCENDKQPPLGNSIIEILKIRTTAALTIARGDERMPSSCHETTKGLSASLRAIFGKISRSGNALEYCLRCPY